MQNGDSITSNYALQYWCGFNDFPMWQNNTILPHPGDTNKYVIFNYNMEKPIDTLVPMPTLLYHHLVDMIEDNGLGAVVQKKQIAIADTLYWGEMAAVKHGNGVDWWVLANEWYGNCYYVVPLTDQGVGAWHKTCEGPAWKQFGGGQATFNPIGTKYVRCDAKNGLWVLDFDNETGLLANPLELTFPQPPSSYRGVCFSPNSRYLYVASYLQLWQFDMEAPDIQGSLQLVGEMDVSNPIPGGGSLAFSQLGADGKIYIAGPGNHTYLSRINKPNCPGTACDFRQWEIALLASNYGGLPNMPHFNIIESSYDCDGVPTQDILIKNVISVSPNPAHDWVNIVSVRQMGGRAEIYTLTGQLVATTPVAFGDNPIRFDLNSGVYVLRVVYDNGDLSSHELVINK